MRKPGNFFRKKKVFRDFCLPTVHDVEEMSDVTEDALLSNRSQGSNVRHHGDARKKPARLARDTADIHLPARSTRQLMIHQQKLMFKFQNLEHQFKKLKSKAGLIKRELDKIRVMKTPEPELPSIMLTTRTDHDPPRSGSDSPRPASSTTSGSRRGATSSASSSVSLAVSAASASPSTIHPGSSCVIRSCYSCSTSSGKTANDSDWSSLSDGSVNLPSLPSASSPSLSYSLSPSPTGSSNRSDSDIDE